MRFTWLVLGLVVAAGAVAFINTDGGAGDLPLAEPRQGDGPGLQRNAPSGPAPASPAAERAEKRAAEILARIGRARAEGDGAEVAALEGALRKEAWDAPAARRYAYQLGQAALRAATQAQGLPALQAKDRARRLLSRVLYLPEMFAADLSATDERTQLIETIQGLNRQVMRYAPGLPGITVPYVVEPGIRPVQIVSREKLALGSNAILFWNQGENLDPTRLRAQQTLLLPQEELTLHVHTRLFRMGIFLGDAFVKEFRVGVGKEETPTPLGEFRVHSREKNPDWWKPGGKRIPFGHADNELGSAWIALESDEWPLSAGYGIHGTNKPATVGTRCSNGCVRLENGGATELYDWVRTASNGGRATRVIIE